MSETKSAAYVPVLLALVGVGLILIYFLQKEDSPVSVVESQAAPEVQTFSAKPLESAAPVTQLPSAQTQVTEDKSQRELQSLKTMTLLLAQYTQSGKDLNELVGQLQREGHKPYMSKNKNPYTGELTIIRTRSPLPGTRYFHAQYFGDAQNKANLQHISFEFRGGPNALENAVNTVYSSFPGIGRPIEDDPEFKQWKLGEDYTVWIKRLDLDDVTADNPFNAYTKADIGTIRMVIEQDPHGGEEHDEDHAH